MSRDQIMIKQCIHDLIDLLDHKHGSIMLDHHEVYNSRILNPD